MLGISLCAKKVQAPNDRAELSNHISLDATRRQMKWSGMSGDAKRLGGSWGAFFICGGHAPGGLDCLAGIRILATPFIARSMAQELLFSSKQTPYFEEEEYEYKIIGDRL